MFAAAGVVLRFVPLGIAAEQSGALCAPGDGPARPFRCNFSYWKSHGNRLRKRAAFQFSIGPI